MGLPTKQGSKEPFTLTLSGARRKSTSCRHSTKFGGYGLYRGTTFFGIIHRDRLYFKVTPETVGHYKGQGMKPFRPNAKQTLKSFYEVPINVLEDAEQLVAWGQESARR